MNNPTFFDWMNSPHFGPAIFLPSAISLAFVIHKRTMGQTVMPPHFIWLTLVGVMLTHLLELATPHNNGIWLVPAWLLGYILLTAKADKTFQEVRLDPLMAFYGTFFSVLIADVTTAAAVGFPLYYLGGMGFKDGLLIYPVIGASICWMTDKMAMRDRRNKLLKQP